MLRTPTHLKHILWVLILAAMALAIACGAAEQATTAPEQPPNPTEAQTPQATQPSSKGIPEVKTVTAPDQPQVTTTPAGNRAAPPETAQDTPATATGQPTPTAEQTKTPEATPTAIPATIAPAATPNPTPNPDPTSEYLYDETSPATDRTVLELLYEQTRGEYWENSEDWTTQAPLDEWYGITTNAQGRVTELNVPDNNLNGTIPREIGNLTHLKVLNLHWGDLEGEIPAEIGNLANLEFLDLGGNSLSEPIPPEIGNLVNLRVLQLGGNALSGVIPPELGNLVQLEILKLASNRIGTFRESSDQKVIPEELGNLRNLTIFLIKPQAALSNDECIPAQLEGQLITDPRFPQPPYCDQ